jgi:hypothetical protein
VSKDDNMGGGHRYGGERGVGREWFAMRKEPKCDWRRRGGGREGTGKRKKKTWLTKTLVKDLVEEKYLAEDHGRRRRIGWIQST